VSGRFFFFFFFFFFFEIGYHCSPGYTWSISPCLPSGDIIGIWHRTSIKVAFKSGRGRKKFFLLFIFFILEFELGLVFSRHTLYTFDKSPPTFFCLVIFQVGSCIFAWGWLWTAFYCLDERFFLVTQKFWRLLKNIKKLT
jgi:hypothetical protein